MNKLTRAFKSLLVPFRVLAYFVANPKSVLLVIIPQGINFIISILLFVVINNWVQDTVMSIEVWTAVRVILNILGGVISFLATGLILLALGAIVSAPFNAIMVENILKQNTVQKIQDFDGIQLVTYEVWRAIKFEVQKLILMSIFFIFTLVLHLIPILGSIFFGIINYLFAMYITGLDLNDIPNEMLRKSFRQKSSFLFKNLDTFAPYLAYSTMLLSIPFVNILYLPFAVIGSTLLYTDIYEQDNRIQGRTNSQEILA